MKKTISFILCIILMLSCMPYSYCEDTIFEGTLFSPAIYGESVDVLTDIIISFTKNLKEQEAFEISVTCEGENVSFEEKIRGNLLFLDTDILEYDKTYILNGKDILSADEEMCDFSFEFHTQKDNNKCLYENDFEDFSQDSITVEKGTYGEDIYVENGVLYLNGGNGWNNNLIVTVPKSKNWSDYKFTFDMIKPTQSTMYPTALFRYQNPTENYMLRYVFSQEWNDKFEREVYYRDYFFDKEETRTVEEYEKFHSEITATDNKFEINEDNGFTYSFEDESDCALNKGGLGFRNYSGIAGFDNIKITDMGLQPIFSKRKNIENNDSVNISFSEKCNKDTFNMDNVSLEDKNGDKIPFLIDIKDDYGFDIIMPENLESGAYYYVRLKDIETRSNKKLSNEKKYSLKSKKRDIFPLSFNIENETANAYVVNCSEKKLTCTLAIASYENNILKEFKFSPYEVESEKSKELALTLENYNEKMQIRAFLFDDIDNLKPYCENLVFTSEESSDNSGKIHIEDVCDKENSLSHLIIKVEDKEKNIIGFKQMNGNCDGKFSADINLDCKSDDYVAYVGGDVFLSPKSYNVHFFNPDEQKSALLIMSECASFDDFKIEFNKYKALMELDEHIFEILKNSDIVLNNIFLTKPFDSVKSFSEDFLKYCTLELINEQTDINLMYNYFETYKDNLQLEKEKNYSLYNSFDNQQKKQTARKLILFSNKMTSFDELYNAFNIAVFLAQIKEAYAYGDITKLMKECRELVYCDKTINYYSLADTSKIDIAVCGNDFDLISQVQDRISSLYNELYVNNIQSGKGNGGGGGGSYTKPSKQITVENETQNVIKQDESEKNEEKKIVFSDLESVPWAKTAIEELGKRGIVDEKSKDEFFPNDNITREEFLKILIKAYEIEKKECELEFEDVEKNSVFSDYISTAVSYGLVKGKNEKEFGMGEYIKRQDMAVLLYRFSLYKKCEFTEETDVFYKDEDAIADYAKNAVATLSHSGILSGMDNGCFAPDSYASRAQASCMIYRMLKLLEKSVTEGESEK